MRGFGEAISGPRHGHGALAPRPLVVSDVRLPYSGVPRLAIVACGFLVAALVLLGMTLGTSDQPTTAVVWGGLALASYAGALLCLTGAGHHDDLGLTRWQLGPWMLLWYGIAFGLATVTWSNPLTTGVSTEIAISSVISALRLVAVGMTAWAIGYCLAPGHATRALAARTVGLVHRRFTGQVRSLAAPWILFAVGIAASLTNSATTGKFGYLAGASSVSTVSGFAGLLGALSLCAPLGIAAASLQVFRERLPRARVTLTVLLLAEVAFGAAAGGKQSYVIAVLAVIIPFSAARRRLPKVMVAVVLLIFLVIVIPFNSTYRQASHRGSLSAGEVIAAAPGILQQTVTGGSTASVLPESLGYLVQRIREIDNPAIILQRTPGQIRFLSPLQLMEDPLAGIVPRALWPGKPIRAAGVRFSREFYELPATTTSADTTIGGLYWYGGWIPVIVGMFVLGCGVRVLDDVLDVRANPRAIFLVLLLFPTLVKGEDDWQTILASLLPVMVVWLLAVALTFRPRRT
jgi:hypothetical protein